MKLLKIRLNFMEPPPSLYLIIYHELLYLNILLKYKKHSLY